MISADEHFLALPKRSHKQFVPPNFDDFMKQLLEDYQTKSTNQDPTNQDGHVTLSLSANLILRVPHFKRSIRATKRATSALLNAKIATRKPT